METMKMDKLNLRGSFPFVLRCVNCLLLNSHHISGISEMATATMVAREILVKHAR
jgi:hypothetical protein